MSIGAPKKREYRTGRMTPEAWAGLLLGFLACLRILIFILAFPFFADTDEAQHLATIYDRLEGLDMGKPEPFSLRASCLIAGFGTFEYLNPPSPEYSAGYRLPYFAQKGAWKGPEFQHDVGLFYRRFNTEAISPPLYYWAEITWWKIGVACGLRGGWLLYWLRLVNVFVYAALMVLLYQWGKTAFAMAPFSRWGLLLFFALWPQTVFYSLNNDNFSALFATAFLLSFISWRTLPDSGSKMSWMRALVAGGMLGASLLSKLTNVPLIAVAVLTLCLYRRPTRAAGPATPWPTVGFWTLGLLPLLVWAGHNWSVSGDATGSRSKAQLLGWTTKPLGQWLENPVFTPSGFRAFWSELLRTLWRGELHWHGPPLAFPPADTFFVLSSTLLLVAAGLAIVRDFRKTPGLATEQVDVLKFISWVCLLTFAAYAGYLAVLALPFDFGRCFYPSRAFPYFASGRLMIGAAMPFAVLYLRGFAELTRACPLKARLFLFGLLMVFAAGTGIGLTVPVFQSQYNFFHLFQARDPDLMQLE